MGVVYGRNLRGYVFGVLFGVSSVVGRVLKRMGLGFDPRFLRFLSENVGNR